jgi:hypothetical protein
LKNSGGLHPTTVKKARTIWKKVTLQQDKIYVWRLLLRGGVLIEHRFNRIDITFLLHAVLWPLPKQCALNLSFHDEIIYRIDMGNSGDVLPDNWAFI